LAYSTDRFSRGPFGYVPHVEDMDSLLEEAARADFVLVNYLTPSGQAVWEWRRGDDSRPRFLIERLAHQWMRRWLDGSRSAITDRRAS
jgi:hypothetical protein